MKLFFIHDSRQTKIGDEEICVVFGGPKEEILRLQISMHDAVVVQIRDRGQCRPDQVGSVRFVV